VGGLRRERQRFDRSAAAASSTLLALAAVGLVVPAIFHSLARTAVSEAQVTPSQGAGLEHSLSLQIAIVLFVAYILNLVFSLGTHRHLYAGSRHAAERPPGRRGIARAVLTLAAATALTAWMSELLVGTVDQASRALGLTQVFVGVIVVAIIGNAAEHSSAIHAAVRDEMDLTLHIAVGSSLQIALFVAPVLIFASYAMPHGPMDLHFTTFEVLSVGVAMLIVNLVAQDGESNWLEGALMLAVYAILGIAFYFLP